MGWIGRSSTTWLFALFAAGASACDPEPQGPGQDGDAPLSDYDALFEGVPGNEELPFDIKADGPAPAQFDLVSLQSPVKSQGRRGVCSVFSTTALMEHLYLSAGMEDPDFSEQYLQWSVKEEVGSFPRTSGSNANYNLQAISRFGIPVESAWPYEISEWGVADDPACDPDDDDRPTRCYTNGAPPAEALAADKFTLPAGRYINSRRDSIIDHMRMTDTAVVVGLDFFYQAWNHRGTTLTRNEDDWAQGIVMFPNDEDVTRSREKRAGHSILLVGWDLELEFPRREADGSVMVDASGEPVMDQGFFIFKNSWGTGSFGRNNPYGDGYGFISMEYVDRYGSARVSDRPTIEPPTPDDGGTDPDPGTGEAEIFSSEEVVEIPDDDPVGIKTSIAVPSDGGITKVTVEYDIAHTYRGDLTVRLIHGDTVVTLHDREGGGEDDLLETVELDDFDHLDRSGEWQLQVVDGAAADTGRLQGWTLLIE
ncbi:MAG: proprotein convertase P-domain-containing protein [Nannocystaceae bacterium]